MRHLKRAWEYEQRARQARSVERFDASWERAEDEAKRATNYVVALEFGPCDKPKRLELWGPIARAFTSRQRERRARLRDRVDRRERGAP